MDVGGNYTLSHAWGNFDGENVGSGPITQRRLFVSRNTSRRRGTIPDGDLQIDQRHRSRLWLNYGVPKVDGLTLSVLQTLASGVPYGASNLTHGERRQPAAVRDESRLRARRRGRSSTTYFFTARDAFRTEGQKRTGLRA